MKKLTLFLFPVFMFLLSRAQTVNRYPFPDTGWVSAADPAAQGWNNDRLAELRRFIADSAHTTGMLVIQNGKRIFSYGDVQEQSYIASCRKSVLAMLYGPFVESGKINLDLSLAQLDIDDVGGLLPIEKTATVRQLLTARSGVYHPAGYAGDEWLFAPNRGSVKPGDVFLYNNWDFNLAGHVFEKLTGVGIYKAVDSLFARPLHMQDWDLRLQHKEGDTSLSEYPAYPMWFSTRDMARLGYLMLREGQWNGKQLLSPGWVRTITTPVTSFREAYAYRGATYKSFGYGYLWWAWDTPYNTGAYQNAYTAQGYFGQYITVLPALDLVVAHKTDIRYERPTENYFRILDKLVAANDAFRPKETATAPDKKRPVKIKSKIAARYVGDYQLPWGNRILTVLFENDSLWFRTPGNPNTPLYALSDSSFSEPGSQAVFTFTQITNGKAGQLDIVERGTPITAQRVIRSTEAVLATYVGSYTNSELGTEYQITLTNGQLWLIQPAIGDTLPLSRTGTDIFIGKRQILRFQHSENAAPDGFLLETKGIPDRTFSKK